MTAEVLSLTRTGSPAPLVPANIDVSAADIMAHDIKHLQKRSARMTAEHFGVWWRLHIASHLEEVTGTLPNNDVDLAIAAGFTAEGVERWCAMKDKVLEDWLLCADGRWHHPSRARNVLHIWIGGRERDRRAMLGNKGKSAKARACVAALEDAIEFGRDALARIDPRDRFLLGLDERISKWPSKADLTESLSVVPEVTTPTTTVASYYDTDGDRDPRNTTATVTVKETKRSEVKETDSSLLCRDDSSGHQVENGPEVEEARGSVKRTTASTGHRDKAPPWPSDWFEAFKASPYPQRDSMAWGRAEKALEKIRRTQRVAFDDILAGVTRLATRVATGTLELRFVPLPSTWLNDRGWEDNPGSPPAPPSPNGRPPSRGPVGNPRAAFATQILEHLHDGSR